MTKLYIYQEFKNFIDDCHRCRIVKNSKNSVMGKENLKSKILFIVGVLGASEDDAGIPYKGKLSVF